MTAQPSRPTITPAQINLYLIFFSLFLQMLCFQEKIQQSGLCYILVEIYQYIFVHKIYCFVCRKIKVHEI